VPEAWHSKLRGAQARSLAWKGNPILAFTSQDSPFWHVSSPFWHVCCASAVVFATSKRMMQNATPVLTSC